MKSYIYRFLLFAGFCSIPISSLAADGIEIAQAIQHPAVEGILTAVIVLSILAEIKTAGFSGGSVIAALAGCLLLGANWYTDGGQVLECILYFGGMALIMMDILLFMTGVAAMAGMVAVLTGLFFTFGSNLEALYILAAAIVIASAGAYFLIGHLSRSRLWDRMTLKAQLTGQEGFRASSQKLKIYEGKQGITLSVLRPAGKIQIDGQILDAQSEGSFIEKGEKVIVKRAENSYLIVSSSR